MNEELDSQLSAMFDDELPAAECELLARRLSRDEPLKARWGRYAVMGAVIRAERGVRLNAPLASRISAVLLSEPPLEGQAAPVSTRSATRWWQPVAATGLAAGVAAASVLWLRAQAPLPGSAPVAAHLTSAPQALAALGKGAQREIPKPLQVAAPTFVQPIELANYVVAHSMFSSPVAGRNLLSSFVTSEASAPAAEESVVDVKNSAQ
jgi:sigma-E factor negative regulatory protein RseA